MSFQGGQIGDSITSFHVLCSFPELKQQKHLNELNADSVSVIAWLMYILKMHDWEIKVSPTTKLFTDRRRIYVTDGMQNRGLGLDCRNWSVLNKSPSFTFIRQDRVRA